MANIDAIKILGSLLNSGALSRGSGSNVLGSVIGALAGGQSASAPSSGGGLGSLVGGMLGGGQQPGGGGLGDLFGMAMQQFGAAQQGNTQQARDVARSRLPAGADYGQMERQAELLVEAMINAAKADGRVDAEEQQKIVDRLGEVSRDELEFVRRELAEPLDVQGFIGRVPRGMEREVYAVSLMAIDLDSNPEAQYLHQLAQGVGLSADACNEIHEALGVPSLYR